MKQKLSAAVFILLGMISLSFLSPVLPAYADESLLQTQEGFGEGEISSAFTQDEPDDVRVTVVKIITVILTLLGIIFVVLIVLAGFKYMTAAGNEDQVKTAIKQITQAVIGLVIILVSWGISNFILRQLVRASSDGNPLIH